MAKNLKKILSESEGLSEEVQADINEAWNEKLSEAREEVTSQLREEFAKKFEHDKGVLAEAMDKFLTDNIRVELEEFAEDKRKVVEERIAYKGKLKEHTSMLNTFITEQVVKEVKELHADKAKHAKSVKTLENFLLKQLSEEIREFRSDKRDLVEQKVKMVREGKAHLNETKSKFVSRAAKLVESSINKALRTEITQFKDDIKIARENEFGRRIYESFVGEYMTSYLNEGTEVSKLQKTMESKDAQLTNLKVKVSKSNKLVEGLELKLNAAHDRIGRNKVMANLLSPLSGSKKDVMKDLLESIQTANLEKAFNKYLPSVLNEAPVKATKKGNLTERKQLTERTGNRAPNKALQEGIDHEFNHQLAEIKALAGLK